MLLHNVSKVCRLARPAESWLRYLTESSMSSVRTLPTSIPSFGEFMKSRRIQDGGSTAALATSAQRRVYIETYGCQMNGNDTEILLGILGQHGYRETPDPEVASVILLNTCSIRDKAEQKVFSRIGELKRLTSSAGGNKAILGIIGCMAERLKSKLFETRAVDIIAGPDALRSIPGLIDLFIKGREGTGQLSITDRMDVQLSVEETYADVTPVRKAGVSAAVSIMRGCNNMCAFCVVPRTRGQERSRDLGSIVNEVKDLHMEGFKEVLLLGQNVNSYADPSTTRGPAHERSSPYYARDFSSVYDPDRRRSGASLFPDLLQECATSCPEMRIKFTSPHPKDFSDDVLQVIATHNNISKILHMPAQSGSTAVLKAMRRGYTREAYNALVDRVRSYIPEIALSTDIISGFCGETEAHHRETVDLIEQVGYDQAFLFAYSSRSQTYAARHLEDNVDPATKLRRLQEVINTYKRVLTVRNQAEVSSRHLVLVEGPSRKEAGILTGKTDTGKRVFFPAASVPASLRVCKGPIKQVPIMAGDYLAVTILSGTAACLSARADARTSIAEFVDVYGKTVDRP